MADTPRIWGSADIGESKDGIKIYRLGLQRLFLQPLCDSSDRLYLSGYHELSINQWDGRHDRLSAIAYSPVFTVNFYRPGAFTPYLELGVGISLITKKLIDSRDMSSHFQFEDRVGVGMRSDAIDLHFRYMHYSNAGLKSPNQGIDIFLVGMAYRF